MGLSLVCIIKKSGSIGRQDTSNSISQSNHLNTSSVEPPVASLCLHVENCSKRTQERILSTIGVARVENLAVANKILLDKGLYKLIKLKYLTSSFYIAIHITKIQIGILQTVERGFRYRREIWVIFSRSTGYRTWAIV